MNKPKKSVLLNINKLDFDTSGASLAVELKGSRNALESKFNKAVKSINISTGGLTLSSKGSSKLSKDNDSGVKLSPRSSYKKAQFTAKNIGLCRGADSIELSIEDGVPMGVISVGQSRIGIGRSKKKGEFHKYSWGKLHDILSYGRQLHDELGRMKSGTVTLLVLTPKNIELELCKKPTGKASGDSEKKTVIRSQKMLLLTGNERILTVMRGRDAR